MENDYRQPRSYELMTVLVPDLDEEATNAAIEKVQATLTTAGQLVHTEQSSPWGRRRLAYTIRHNGQDYRDGYYLLTYFTAMPDRTDEIERELKLDPRVIRYLLLQSEPFVAPEPEAGEGAPEAEGAAETAAEGAAASAAAGVGTAGTNGASEPAPAEQPAAEPANAETPAEASGPETAEAAAPAETTATAAAPEAASTEEG